MNKTNTSVLKLQA